MPAYYLLATTYAAPSATGVMRQQQGLLLLGIGNGTADLYRPKDRPPRRFKFQSTRTGWVGGHAGVS